MSKSKRVLQTFTHLPVATRTLENPWTKEQDSFQYSTEIDEQRQLLGIHGVS